MRILKKQKLIFRIMFLWEIYIMCFGLIKKCIYFSIKIVSVKTKLYIFFILRLIYGAEFDENFRDEETANAANSGRFHHVELGRDDVCRITASFVKGLGKTPKPEPCASDLQVQQV